MSNKPTPDWIERMDFAEEIERIALEKEVGILDAVLEFADMIEWEPEWLTPYITGPLKEKLRLDAVERGMLRTESMPQYQFE